MDEDFTGWVGRSETVSDSVTATPYAELAALLDRPAFRPAEGTVLPPLWHWLYFLPLHRHSSLGSDGHPRRGGFLPPVPLPRRMWAASQIEFHLPLHVGDRLTRVSTIESVSEKSGRSGALVFVRVRHEVRRDQDLALTEWHDIVYRETAQRGGKTTAASVAPFENLWQREWRPDPVLLFRYSALTMNGHRIHYDHPYATQVEGYPGLVVHGPLIATLLLDLLRQHQPEAQVQRFEFRALRPMFSGNPFQVCGQPVPDGGEIRLWAADHEGAMAMDATATLRRAV